MKTTINEEGKYEVLSSKYLIRKQLLEEGEIIQILHAAPL